MFSYAQKYAHYLHIKIVVLVLSVLAFSFGRSGRSYLFDLITKRPGLSCCDFVFFGIIDTIILHSEGEQMLQL